MSTTLARFGLAHALIIALVLGVAPATSAGPSLPFDEETLDEIDALNRAITSHYEKLQQKSEAVEQRRAGVNERVETLEAELATIDRERSEIPLVDGKRNETAMRVLEEHRVEVKSRYLEALAEKHALDVEAVESFETHGTVILTNLERLASALETSGRLEEEDDGDGQTAKALHSLQRGTAIALNVLEEWGAMTREDPRFRALWATSRVLNRNVQRMRAQKGVKATVDLVRERTFVVRSLIDQARALRAALDQQGLLLQVAAQNQMLRFHFSRLGAINGMELPDLDIDDSTRRILEDIEEEPYGAPGDSSNDALAGFDDCLYSANCQ